MKLTDLVGILEIATGDQPDFHKLYYGIVKWMRSIGYPVDDPNQVVLDMDTLSGSYFIGEDRVTFSFTKVKQMDRLFVYLDGNKEVVQVFANIQGISEEILTLPLRRGEHGYTYTNDLGETIEVTEDAEMALVSKLLEYIQYKEVIKHQDNLLRWLSQGVVMGQMVEGKYLNRFVKHSVLEMLKNPTEAFLEALTQQLKEIYLGEEVELELSGMLGMNLLELLKVDETTSTKEVQQKQEEAALGWEDEVPEELVIGAVEELPIKVESNLEDEEEFEEL